MKFAFGSNKPVSGEASVFLEAGQEEVFTFVAQNFFVNYPKWSQDVVELEILDGIKVSVGVKGKQVRKDNDALIESTFEITDFNPNTFFSLKGLEAPYAQTYSLASEGMVNMTKLTFRFDLLEIEIFMRPFEKLIRVAIEDGVETAVENIKNLIVSSTINT